MNTPKYWIATISREHTQRAITGNFIQVCHGKQSPLKRMRQGDYLLIYSSKVTMEGNEKCQAFTAVGQVTDNDVYQLQMTDTFKPFRRNIRFLKSKETPITPLINELSFIPNKKSWGYPFRFGFFEIKEHDFSLITSQMLNHEIEGQYV